MRVKKSYTLGLLLIFFNLSVVWADKIPVIAAAASSQFALKEIVQTFKQDTGHRIRMSFSSSGHLSHQIQQGAPFDLFLSANRLYSEQVKQQSAKPLPSVVIALGRLVFMTTKKSALPITRSDFNLQQAITQKQIRYFAIANPQHAPYGAAAQQVLVSLQLWQTVQDSLVLGENASQAAQFVLSGAAQLGIVSYALARSLTLNSAIKFVLIPRERHQPLAQVLLLLRPENKIAAQFYAYMQTAKVRGILKKYGYMSV